MRETPYHQKQWLSTHRIDTTNNGPALSPPSPSSLLYLSLRSPQLQLDRTGTLSDKRLVLCHVALDKELAAVAEREFDEEGTYSGEHTPHKIH